MDALEREEILNSIMEIKELVDEVLPTESSVVRDQILSMLVVSTIQAKLMAKFAPPAVAQGQFDVNQLVQQSSNMLFSSQQLEKEKTAAILTQVAAKKGKEWAWEAYEDFLRKVRNV